MSDRKHTPDVLADILAGTAPALRSSGAVGSETEAVPVSRPKPPVERQPSTRQAIQRAPQPGQPPAWEYLVVSCQDYHGWRPRYVNGIEVCGWMSGPLIHDYLDERGQEGWELVGVAAGKPMYSVSDFYQLYFKRARR